MSKSFLRPQPLTEQFVRPDPMPALYEGKQGMIGMYQLGENQQASEGIGLYFWRGGPNPIRCAAAEMLRKYVFVNDAKEAWQMLVDGVSIDQVKAHQHGLCKLPDEVKPVDKFAARRRKMGKPDPLLWL